MQPKQLPRWLKEAKNINDYADNVTAAKTKVSQKTTIRDNASNTLQNITIAGAIPAAQAALDAANTDLKAAETEETEARNIHREMLKPVKVDYSYSYREYLINKRKTGESEIISGGKNSCIKKSDGTDCWTPKYPGGFQNYTGNGAVTSGLRLTNLKLNAIRGGVKCKDAAGNTHCKGVYFAGKPRWTGWIFNKNHPEINFPQLKAKRRTYSLFTGSGLFERKLKKIGNKNDGSCCGGKPLFDITGCCP